MRTLEIVGDHIVFCPHFSAGKCTALRANGGSGCPVGRDTNCNLVAGKNTFASACTSVVFLMAKHLADHEWDEDVFAAIISDSACMVVRQPENLDLVREKLVLATEIYFTNFK